MLEIQEGQLEKYNSKDFKNFSVAPKIIVQVREFKKQIEDTQVKVKSQENLLEGLNEKFKNLQCDKHDKMDEATKLLK